MCKGRKECKGFKTYVQPHSPEKSARAAPYGRCFRKSRARTTIPATRARRSSFYSILWTACKKLRATSEDVNGKISPAIFNRYCSTLQHLQMVTELLIATIKTTLPVLRLKQLDWDFHDDGFTDCKITCGHLDF